MTNQRHTLRPIRILVCGGRMSTLRSMGIDTGLLANKLSKTLTEIWACGKREVTIIHGGADGADEFANTWAFCTRSPHLVFPIPKEDWDRVGSIAGALRNTKMLAEGKPDIGISLPGGNGTADMVKKMKAAGLRVLEIEL